MTFDQELIDALFFRPPHLERPNAMVARAWIGHIPFLYWLIAKHKPACFVELGVHHGNSYFAACEAVQRLGLETLCYGVDTWQGDPHAGEYDENVWRSFEPYNAERYGGFSTPLRTTFDDAVTGFQDGQIDLLHIDGLHTYEAVKKDFETWLPKLATKAIVLFHDTNERTADFGVYRFWEEVTQEGSEYKGFEFLHSHGLGVLGIGFSGNFLYPDTDLTVIKKTFAQAGLSKMIETAHSYENQQLRSKFASITQIINE